MRSITVQLSIYYGKQLICKMFTSSSDVDRLIISCLTFSEFVRYLVPTCKKWNNDYKRLVGATNTPQGYHGLSLHTLDSLTAQQLVLFEDITCLRYLRLANATTIPELPLLECLDLDMIKVHTPDLTHINSCAYPRLKHLIVRHAEYEKFGDLNLDTLTFYGNLFTSSDNYLDKIKRSPKVRFHGCMWAYETESEFIRDVEIHTPTTNLQFVCSLEMNRVVINVNSKIDYTNHLYQSDEPDINFTGDVSGLRELIIIGGSIKMAHSRVHFRNLRVFKVSLNLLHLFKKDFPFVEAVKLCENCGVIPKEPLICERCLNHYYCSRRCESEDWASHHSSVCSPNIGKIM